MVSARIRFGYPEYQFVLFAVGTQPYAGNRRVCRGLFNVHSHLTQPIVASLLGTRTTKLHALKINYIALPSLISETVQIREPKLIKIRTTKRLKQRKSPLK